MSKKDFKTNPTMQFITNAIDSEKKAKEKEALDNLNVQEGITNLFNEFNKSVMVETKSRRLQVLIKPSIYYKLKNYADENGISVNESLNRIIDSYL